MAAQTFFAAKTTSPTDSAMPNMPNMPGMDHSMHRMQMSTKTSSVSLPYQFPAPGNYRIWVQFKIADRVLTGVFDAQVGS